MFYPNQCYTEACNKGTAYHDIIQLYRVLLLKIKISFLFGMILFYLILYVPVNNLSVTSGPVSLR